MGARVHILLTDDLLIAVDQARGDLSRSAYIRRALQAQVGEDEQIRAVLQAVVGEEEP